MSKSNFFPAVAVSDSSRRGRAYSSDSVFSVNRPLKFFSSTFNTASGLARLTAVSRNETYRQSAFPALLNSTKKLESLFAKYARGKPLRLTRVVFVSCEEAFFQVALVWTRPLPKVFCIARLNAPPIGLSWPISPTIHAFFPVNTPPRFRPRQSVFLRIPVTATPAYASLNKNFARPSLEIRPSTRFQQTASAAGWWPPFAGNRWAVPQPACGYQLPAPHVMLRKLTAESCFFGAFSGD